MISQDKKVQLASILSISLLFLLSINSCKQNRENESYPFYTGLSNYTIPIDSEGAFVGQLSREGVREYNNLKIISDTSNLFCIDSSGYLRLKESVKLSQEDPREIFELFIGDDIIKKRVLLVKDLFLNNPIVAHRGAWKEYDSPQNSIASLKNAIELGCGWSELDVWLTSDSIPVICHDPTFDGKIIEKSTLLELRNSTLSNGEPIPTLKEALVVVMSQIKTKIFIELKPSQISPEQTVRLAQKVVELVHTLGAQGWVKYISFDIGALSAVLEKDHFASTAYLGKDKGLEELHDLNMWGIDFNKSLFEDGGKIIQEAHELGLTVNAWTVNDSTQMSSLLERGIDYITTDHPKLLKQIVIEKETLQN